MINPGEVSELVEGAVRLALKENGVNVGAREDPITVLSWELENKVSLSDVLTSVAEYTLRNRGRTTLKQFAAIRDLCLHEHRELVPKTRDSREFLVIHDDLEVYTVEVDQQGNATRDTLNNLGEGWSRQVFDFESGAWSDEE